MTYKKLGKYTRIALAEYQGQKFQRRETVRMDLLYETGEHTILPYSLGGSKENSSFPKVVTECTSEEKQTGADRRYFRGTGSLVFIEMIGFWNNRGQMVVLTIRGKVGEITIMDQSGIQCILTHRALWQR